MRDDLQRRSRAARPRRAAAGGEVFVSRGQLVEIGGGFRVPEVLAASGCRLVEVGRPTAPAWPTTRAASGPGRARSCASPLELPRRRVRRGGPDRGARGPRARARPRAHRRPGKRRRAPARRLPASRTRRRAWPPAATSWRSAATSSSAAPRPGSWSARPGRGARAAPPLMRALRPDKLILAALEATLALHRDPRRAARAHPRAGGAAPAGQQAGAAPVAGGGDRRRGGRRPRRPDGRRRPAPRRAPQLRRRARPPTRRRSRPCARATPRWRRGCARARAARRAGARRRRDGLLPALVARAPVSEPLVLHRGACRPRQDRARPGPDGARHRPPGGREVARHLDRARLRAPRPAVGPHAVSLVDVPGHERFVRHGRRRGGVDGYLLCVAADDGVMPQTRSTGRCSGCWASATGSSRSPSADLA